MKCDINNLQQDHIEYNVMYFNNQLLQQPSGTWDGINVGSMSMPPKLLQTDHQLEIQIFDSSYTKKGKSTK